MYINNCKILEIKVRIKLKVIRIIVLMYITYKKFNTRLEKIYNAF